MAQLKTLDIKLNDTDIVDVLIFNLHESWDTIASSLTTATGELKISDVTGALMDKEGRRGGPVSDSDSPAFAMYSKANIPQRRQRICFHCQCPSHLQDNCHMKRDINGQEIAQIAFEVNNSLNDMIDY